MPEYETVHGHEVRGEENGGGSFRLVKVDGREYVLTEEAYQEVVSEAEDAASFRAGVLESSQEAGAEWARERGPDSPLGRGQEAGQEAETDHGGAPA
jgi:hypothetical protein